MVRKPHPLLLAIPALLLLLTASPSLAQLDPGALTYTTVPRVNFFTTFLRTPFAIMVAIVSVLGTVAAGFFEFFGWLFTGFDYKFPVAKEVWNLGWRTVVKEWWWSHGVTWHLLISLFIWLGVLGKVSR